jgi:Gram-negative bacterial TonB protein C-terminal
MGRHTLIVFAAIAVAACAGASQTTTGKTCALASADSVFLKRGPVYRDCAVEQRAQLVARREPEFHPDLSAGQSCYSADLEFVVDTTGTPEAEGARVVRATNPIFGDAVLAVVPSWQYKPAYLHGAPVRQIVKEKLGVAGVRVSVPAGGTPRPPDRVPKC